MKIDDPHPAFLFPGNPQERHKAMLRLADEVEPIFERHSVAAVISLMVAHIVGALEGDQYAEVRANIVNHIGHHWFGKAT
jgi:hypothetical protein